MTRGQRIAASFHIYARAHTYGRENWGKNRATAIPFAWKCARWKWRLTRGVSVSRKEIGNG